MAIIPWGLAAKLELDGPPARLDCMTLYACVVKFRDMDPADQQKVVAPECICSIYLTGFTERQRHIGRDDIRRLVKQLPKV